jgi:type IV secretion system protein VirB4
MKSARAAVKRPINRTAAAKRETAVGTRLPYAAHIDDHVIRLRDGMMMSIIKLDGFPFETADPEELDYRQRIRSTLLKSIATSEFALYQNIIRRRVYPYPDGEFTDPFCRALNAAWQQRIGENTLYINDLYLTVIRRPLQGKVGVLDSAFRLFKSKTDKEGSSLRFDRDKRELKAGVDTIMAALQPYGPRLLGVYETQMGTCSEPAEFLSCLYNNELRSVLLPRGDLGHFVPYKRISFGDEAFEVRGNSEADDYVGAMVSIKDYPIETVPGLLDMMLRLPHELVISQSYGFIDRQVAVERIDTEIRRMERGTNQDTDSLYRDLKQAKDDVSYGRSAYGEHHLTVQIKASNLTALDDAVSDVIASFTDIGIIAVREDLNMEPSYWAQFPGNFKDIARNSLIATGNFAAFASLHNFPVGQPDGNHWGPALTILETTSGTPYFFNFHRFDKGNWEMYGATGGGKTVNACFFLAQSQKYNPNTFYFDKDRGAEIFIRAIGGVYSLIRAGEPTGFNPLQLEDSQINRAFVRSWVARLVKPVDGDLQPEELEIIAEAVEANFDQPHELRTLANFSELFRGRTRIESNDLYARLAPWHGTGEHAWLFDNPHDTLDMSARVMGFDMTYVLDEPIIRTPTMMYLFHRVEQRLDGTPTMIVIDEGWKALDDEEFVRRIKNWEKTIRKQNGSVGFITQSVGDAIASKVGKTISEQSATQIFLPNPKATREDYVEGLKLSEYEYQLIRELPDTSRCFLIKQGRDAVIARLSLDGYNEILAVLSGREQTVRALDHIRANVGDEPRAWLPPFITHIREKG